MSIFEEDGVMIQFFAYVVLITGHTVWAMSQHLNATPMTMYALFFVTGIELLMLSELSDWSFIHLITNKEVKEQ